MLSSFIFSYSLHTTLSGASSVNIVTRLWAEQMAETVTCFPSPLHSNWLWGPLSFLSNG